METSLYLNRSAEYRTSHDDVGQDRWATSGRVVALPETRELDRMVDLLAKEDHDAVVPDDRHSRRGRSSAGRSWLRLLLLVSSMFWSS